MLQVAAFCALLYVPAEHALQVRSAVVEPAALTRWPGSHVVHAVHEAAFAVVLNVPVVHVEHWRLLVAVPATLTL